MKIGKRLMAFFLAVLLTATLLPVSAFAQEVDAPLVGNDSESTTEGLVEETAEISDEKSTEVLVEEAVQVLTVTVEDPDFAGGTGTEDDPYLIETKYHLDNVRNYLDAHFKMTADIEFTEADFAQGGDFYNDGTGWQPIGRDLDTPFTGTFDGNGHKITDLMIDIISDDYAYVGLFGYAEYTQIKNLGMVNACIQAGKSIPDDADYFWTVYTGGIIGYAENSTITNCYNTGDITSGDYIGGIVGSARESTVSGCYNTGSITTPDGAVGGVVGYAMYSTVSNCHNTGNIQAKATVVDSVEFAPSSYAGGIVGLTFNSTVSKCYNTGNVIAEAIGERFGCDNDGAAAVAGGVVGRGEAFESDDTIIDCYNKGNVTITIINNISWFEINGYVGGVVGEIINEDYWDEEDSITIVNCYNTGCITATAELNASNSETAILAGGIAGTTFTSVEDDAVINCYNTGSVTVTETANGSDTVLYSYVGGIVGQTRLTTVSNCYNTGSITAKAAVTSNDVNSYARDFVGGIVGHINTSIVSDCYNTGNIAVTGTAAHSDSYTRAYVGGITGYSWEECTLRNSYNTGSVAATATAGNSGGNSACYVGGVLGFPWEEECVLTIANCYYIDTVQQGVGDGEDSTTKCTAGQMKQQATFAGFDFDEVWTMGGNENYPYPELQNVTMDYTRSLQSISVTKQPAKLKYLEAKDQLSVSDGQITLTYSDGTTETVNITPEMVTGFDNTKVGKQTLTVTCEGKTATYTVEVVKKALTATKLTKAPTKLVYRQKSKKLVASGGEITLYYNNGTIAKVKLTDKMISGYSSKKTGTQTVYVKYGTLSQKIKVKTYYDLSEGTASASKVTYTGKSLKPSVTVRSGTGSKLSKSYYSASYSNNVKPGQGVVTVTGKGKYDGTIKTTFSIVPAKASKPKVTVKDGVSAVVKISAAKGAQWYNIYVNGKLNTQTKSTTCTITGLKPGVSQKITVRAGATVSGKDYLGSESSYVKVTPRHSMSKSTVTVSKTTLIYNGKSQKPAVTVRGYQGAVLKNGTDYTVKYSSNKYTGKATVTITGKGKYTGTIKAYFAIKPAPVTGLKMKSATANSVTVSFTKASSKAAKYYEIYLDGKYVGKTTSSSYTIKNLQPGQSYQVYVVATRTVSGVKYKAQPSKTLTIQTKAK